MNEISVSLDLETTGLNPELDRIIEIGIVKFNKDQIIDTFNSLVNPGCLISPRIQMLCCISQYELDRAPGLSQVSKQITDFIGEYPIVGHNISFDLNFLLHNGITFRNTKYDTLELSTLFLFQQPDYSLASLSKYLNLTTPVHRALPDALASKELFLVLLEHASQLDIPVLEELVHLAEKADWELVSLFRKILSDKAKNAFITPKRYYQNQNVDVLTKLDEEKSAARPQKAPLDIKDLGNILDINGPLAQSFPGYEYRPSQIQMMREVAHALNNNNHLIVEAGTGTGKSIAYLLPAISFSLENGMPAVISTNTINLQEQLIHKDMPHLLSALDPMQNTIAGSLKVVQLKGRSNYLCLKKYYAFRSNEYLSVDEARLCARIMIWLLSTQTGDRAELNINVNEQPIWARICSQYEERIESQCPYRQKGICFLHHARKSAEDAHLIIVNHALLLSDLVADAKILPPYTHLIIDEAHHLEDEATNQLGCQITQWDLFDYFNRLRRETSERHWSGLLSMLVECFLGSSVAISRQRQIKQITESLNSQMEKGRILVLQLLDRIRTFIDSHTSDRGEYERQLRLTWEQREWAGWPAVESIWENLNLVFRDIADHLEQLYTALQDLESNKVSRYDYLMVEIPSLLYRTTEFVHHMDSLISNPEPDGIYWISLDRLTNAVSINIAPLRVDTILNTLLFSSKKSVILTGATLSSEGTFDYIKSRLGLEHADELLLEAPFDYPQAAMIYLPEELPSPTAHGYQYAVEQTIIATCLASRGRMLVLFTSHAALRATQVSIQAPLEKEGILVLAQGIDGPPKRLLDAFKNNPETVLLGASSFWEGIDIVGDALSVVVITKLPFNVPTEPIFAARSELFDDPFKEYSIPKATIRFKQGFGRLIRSKSDRGVIVILDKRLQSKSYSSSFFDSIPECTVIKGSSRNLPFSIKGWLDRK